MYRKYIPLHEEFRDRNERAENKAWGEAVLRKLLNSDPKFREYFNGKTEANQRSRMAILNHQREMEELERKRWG